MANPYTAVTISGYNANPPSDDGTEATQNEVAWSKPKEKLGDPLKTAIETMDTNITTAFAATVHPPGAISPYAGSSAPTGWLICDGTTGLNSVSDTTLADLFGIIGVTFGGTGAADFDLPDLRGYFVRGFDNGAGNDPDAAGRTGGDAIGSTQAGAMEAHIHSDDFALSSGTNVMRRNSATFDAFTGSGNQAPDATNNLGITGTVGAVSGATTSANETRPLNIALNYIIKK